MQLPLNLWRMRVDENWDGSKRYCTCIARSIKPVTSTVSIVYKWTSESMCWTLSDYSPAIFFILLEFTQTLFNYAATFDFMSRETHSVVNWSFVFVWFVFQLMQVDLEWRVGQWSIFLHVENSWISYLQ